LLSNIMQYTKSIFKFLIFFDLNDGSFAFTTDTSIRVKYRII